MSFNVAVPCLFGLEGLVSDELKQMGMKQVSAKNGQVCFTGGTADVAKANVCLRTGERILICLKSFHVQSFDALFEGVKSIPWEDYLPEDASFPVNGHCLDSVLHSVPDCQRIIKKSVAVRLSSKYGKMRLPETGKTYSIRFSLMKDVAEIYLDSSGTALHKRGYRPNANSAPLRETLAAAIVKLSRYKGRETFIDPFCGSGTIAIEAALTAKNRAPGLNRNFAAENWEFINAKVWNNVREEAVNLEYSGEYLILGSDIDGNAVTTAKENAVRAGVSDIIRFETGDAVNTTFPEGRAILAANPPYGERLSTLHDAEILYRQMGRVFLKHSETSLYILSGDPDFEKHFGKTAKKRRKLYNGMIPCQLYMYF